MRADQMQLKQNARTLLIEDSANAERVKAFIAARFAQEYGARVCEFMPHLLALVETQLNIRATLGYRRATEGALFLEAYLPAPLETCISAQLGFEVERGQILELGNLSADSAGATRLLILSLAPYFAAEGVSWLAMTATAQVRNIFARLGLAELLIPLAQARASALSHTESDWGSYYRHQPQVCVLDLQAALEAFSSNAMLQRVMAGLPAPARDCHLQLAQGWAA